MTDWPIIIQAAAWIYVLERVMIFVAAAISASLPDVKEKEK